jgi:O-antigen ligase
MILGNRNFFQSAATFSLIATCLVLPVATSLLSLFSILTLILWLLSGKYRDLPLLIKNNSLVFLAILLFILFILGMSYTSANFSEALSYLKKYRELLFIPIVISLLQDKPIVKKRCETAFLFGCIFLLLTSYCLYFSIIPAAKFGNSILFHITHSFFMSILAFYAAHKSIDSQLKKFKSLWILIFILCVFNMFYIAPGRTGMLVFIFLMILLFLQRLSALKLLLSLVVLTLLVLATYITSDNFSARSKLAFKEIQSYEYGASRSSLGMRFDWWIDSLALIKEKPILGHGTGSFTTEHEKFISGSKIMKTDNPHNEFLLIGVQLGLVGVTVFILLFISQLLCSFKLEKPDKLFAQGVLIAMVIGCTMNSFLFDSHQGHFWAILSAVYFSTHPNYSIRTN